MSEESCLKIASSQSLLSVVVKITNLFLLFCYIAAAAAAELKLDRCSVLVAANSTLRDPSN